MVPHPPAEFRHSIVPAAAMTLGDGQAPVSTFQEWFSAGVVTAVASAAGLVPQVMPIDANKIDMQVQTWGPFEGRMRVIGLQLKSTHRPQFSRDRSFLSYSLDRADYEQLRAPGSIPRFLVVVVVPRPTAPWVRVRSNIVALGAAAWWCAITDPTPISTDTKTIRVPTENRLDAPALLNLMRHA